MSDHTANEHIAPGEPHHHASSHPVIAFSDAQRESLHAEDFAAGKAVVILMLSIFQYRRVDLFDRRLLGDLLFAIVKRLA